MAFNEFIQQGNKVLRCGYTTGSCATLASKAAAIMLLSQKEIATVDIITPKGIPVIADVLDITITKNKVTCAIQKDAGDDIDVTDGMLIYATVTSNTSTCDITIKGGVGIGKVTKKGLNQPVGEWAINSTPRKMICDELSSLAKDYSYNHGFITTIFAPNGEEIAKKTFNSNLGIVGGISIIGTSGIVEPQSLQALLDTIKVEVNMHNQNNQERLIITFGNYGQDFITENNFEVLSSLEQIKISNFIGDTLDLIYNTNIKEVMLVGHIGKVVKLAGGIMNTHSKYADCRTEIFASYSALMGATQPVIADIMQSATTDACIEILDNINLREVVLTEIISSASKHIHRRINDKFQVGIITFSNSYGLLAKSTVAEELLLKWKG